MVKQRHIPTRTCISCRETDEKRDLLRVVRQPDGTLKYDPKGKISGRGAYVCASLPCIQQARKQKRLERSLKVSVVPEEVFQELAAMAASSSPESVVPVAEIPSSELLKSELSDSEVLDSKVLDSKLSEISESPELHERSEHERSEEERESEENA